MRLEPGEERERADEGRDAEDEPDERGRRDDPDLRVAPRGEEVAAGEEGFRQRAAFGRMSGKRMTSRIEREPVKSMASRSMPTPSPAVGGIP